MSIKPIILVEKCDGCGLCVSVCKCNALRIEDYVITAIEVEDCDWCTQCEAVCPTGAILCQFEIVIEEF